MQLRISAFAIAIMVGIGLSLPILAFAYPPQPGPSAYPPRPAPKPKYCPTALVCCDSYRQPYESDAAHLIDLLKVELTVAEKALGVGLTCDAIVGLQREERRRKMRRHGFDFGWDEDEEEPDEEEPDEEELDEDEKEFRKRGVDVWFVTSFLFSMFGSGTLGASNNDSAGDLDLDVSWGTGMDNGDGASQDVLYASPSDS